MIEDDPERLKSVTYDPDRPGRKPRFQKISEIMARKNVGIFGALSESRREKSAFYRDRRRENLKPENITKALFGKTLGTAVARARGASEEEIRRVSGLRRATPIKAPISQENALPVIARNTKETNEMLHELVEHFKRSDRNEDIDRAFGKSNQMRQESLLKRILKTLAIGAAIGGAVNLGRSIAGAGVAAAEGGGGMGSFLAKAGIAYYGYKALKTLRSGYRGVFPKPEAYKGFVRSGEKTFTGNKAASAFRSAGRFIGEKTGSFLKAAEEKAPSIIRGAGKIIPGAAAVAEKIAKGVEAKPIASVIDRVGKYFAKPGSNFVKGAAETLGAGKFTKIPGIPLASGGFFARTAGKLLGWPAAVAQLYYEYVLEPVAGGEVVSGNIKKLLDKMTPEELLKAKEHDASLPEKLRRWNNYIEPYIKKSAPEKLKKLEELENKRTAAKADIDRRIAEQVPNVKITPRLEMNKPPQQNEVKQAGNFLAKKDFTKEHEGLPEKSLSQFKDSNGEALIGYGHKITPKEQEQGFIDLGNEKIDIRGKITKAQASRIKDMDMARETRIGYNILKQKGVDVNKLAPNVRTALDDLMFQTGGGIFKKTPKLVEALKANNISLVAQELKDIGLHDTAGNRLRGLEKRANDRARMVLDTPKSQVGPILVDASKASKQASQPIVSAPVVTNITNNNVSGGMNGRVETASVRSDENSYRRAQDDNSRSGM